MEKFQAWSDCDGDPGTVFSREEMLDNIMLYWLTGSGASAARLYWESYARRSSDPVPVPAGVLDLPQGDLPPVPPLGRAPLHRPALLE